MTSGVASAATGLTLMTDKSAYNVKELVIITITNVGEETVTIPSGYYVVNEEGLEVYHAPSIFYMAPMATGDTYTYIWDQTCDDGTAVPTGDYTIHTPWDSIEVKLFDSSTSSGRGGGNDFNLPMLQRPRAFA